MTPHRPLVLTVLAASLALAAAPARAEDARVAAPSKIAKVTVYSDRALVERTATASVGSGTSRIVLDGLPASFDANSLRARSSEVRVLGVDTEVVHSEKTHAERVESARAELVAAKRALAAAEMDLADAKDTWDRLRSIRATATEGAAKAIGGAGGTDLEGLERTLDFVTKKSADARRALLAAQDAADTARQAAELAERRFREVSGAAATTATRVIVTVTAGAPTSANLSLQYAVSGASWRPVYDLRVGEDFVGANLEMAAIVEQRTGEDWRGVPLELTTAQPAAGAAPPEPHAWIIDLYAPRPAKGMVSHDAPEVSARALRAVSEAKLEDKDADAWQGVVRRTGLVVAFQSVLPGDVASDGRPARIALGRWPVTPDVKWTAFPRATDKVFVTTKLTNTTGAPLPAGEARVFVGPDFVGPMGLDDWQTGKEIDVGLGVDREVTVSRETLTDERGTEGVFSKDTVHSRAFRISMKNHRAKSVAVRLLDQVPVSRDEDLVVVVTSNSLPFATLGEKETETNRARGVLEWAFSLGAGQETEIRFAWRATHPQGRMLSGM
jgi:uncharacterized protein (TIGR02231 family)